MEKLSLIVPTLAALAPAVAVAAVEHPQEVRHAEEGPTHRFAADSGTVVVVDALSAREASPNKIDGGK